MKPEEAIKRIENLIKGREDPRGKTELDFALDMAIEALKEQKQKENGVERPHGEWIIRKNRQGKHIYSVCSRCNVAHLDTDFPNFCEKCVHYCVCMVNSYWHERCGYYEPARPRGEWIETGYYTYCSICGNGARWSYNFCPNCGAKMIERSLRAKMGFVDDAANGKIDLEYLKIGNTIYTQDSDKQGWTGRKENN